MSIDAAIAEAVRQAVREELAPILAAVATAQESEPVERGPLVYTVPEAAEALRLSTAYVYEMVATRRLRAVKEGKRVLIPVAEAQRYIEAKLQEATACDRTVASPNAKTAGSWSDSPSTGNARRSATPGRKPKPEPSSERNDASETPDGSWRDQVKQWRNG